MHDEYKYVGYKKQLIAIPAIVAEDSIQTDSKTEHYKSLYKFDEDILKYKSLSAIKRGVKFYADYLAFDIDNEKLEGAYDDFQKLVEYLDFREIGYESWFSGSKGFHVMIPTVQFAFQPTEDESILKRMAEAIAEKVMITIDTKIYNKTRIFRMPNTLNVKSGLYKIGVIPSTSLKDMKFLARVPMSMLEYPECDDYVMNDTLNAVYQHLTNEIKINRTILPTEDYKDTRIFIPAQEGDRNDALYKIARKLARRSIGETDALLMCAAWSLTLAKPMTAEEIKRTVISAYTKGMNELVDESNFKDQFFDAKRSLAGVQRMIQNLSQTIIKTGYKFLDDYTMGIFKGDVIFIIARPGNFKTCFLSSILRSISMNTGGKTLMFSMEMHPDRLGLRHMQSSENMGQMQVIEAVKNGHKFETYKKEFENVIVIGLSSLSIEMVLGLIDYYIEEYGPISGIGFDYLSLFKGAANNTEVTARVATELKTRVARAANCPVFCLVQARRAYEGDGGDIEIDRQAGKDSSSIEDSADYMIGLWGKEYGRILKSRAFNSKQFKEGPYFKTDVNRPIMRLNDIKLLDDFDCPKFKQVQRGQGD